MKILFAACMCMLSLVGEWSAPSPKFVTPIHPFSFLGSREAIIQYMQDHVSSFGVSLTVSNISTSYTHTPYTKENGPIQAFVGTNFGALVSTYFTAADVSKVVHPRTAFGWGRVTQTLSNGALWTFEMQIACGHDSFAIQTNNEGKIIVPTNVVTKWPLSQWLFVTNSIQKNIERIEYVWKNASGTVFRDYMTTNGSYSLLSDIDYAMPIPVGQIASIVPARKLQPDFAGRSRPDRLNRMDYPGFGHRRIIGHLPWNRRRGRLLYDHLRRSRVGPLQQGIDPRQPVGADDRRNSSRGCR